MIVEFIYNNKLGYTTAQHIYSIGKKEMEVLYNIINNSSLSFQWLIVYYHKYTWNAFIYKESMQHIDSFQEQIKKKNIFFHVTFIRRGNAFVGSSVEHSQYFKIHKMTLTMILCFLKAKHNRKYTTFQIHKQWTMKRFL